MVNIKKKITKKLALQLALFVAVISMASLFDYFFDDDIAILDKIEAETNQTTKNQNTVYLINQINSVGVKSTIQLVTNKKLQIESNDKYIQKYHQLRNYQVLKAEVQTQTTPLIDSYHYLAFKNFYFSDPDDDSSGA